MRRGGLRWAAYLAVPWAMGVGADAVWLHTDALPGLSAVHYCGASRRSRSRRWAQLRTLHDSFLPVHSCPFDCRRPAGWLLAPARRAELRLTAG